MPQRATDEVRLFARASAWLERNGGVELEGRGLSRLTEAEGIDIATAVLHEWLRGRPINRSFIDEIDRIQREREFRGFAAGTLLIVPASFYREFPGMGADGALLAEVGAAMGLLPKRIDVSSRASVKEGADCLLRALETPLDRPVILASLSKGGADVRVALEKNPEAFEPVHAWVQIGGLLRGSPLADDLMKGPAPRRLASRLVLALIQAPAELVRGLCWHEAPLGEAISVPPSLRVVNVVGCPIRSHLVGNVAARWQFLSKFGPNDGTSLVLDSIVPDAPTYPIWGADHYFRLPGMAELLYALFAHLAGQVT